MRLPKAMLTAEEAERIIAHSGHPRSAGAARPRDSRDAVLDRDAAHGAGESEGVGPGHESGDGEDPPGQGKKDRFLPLGDRAAAWVRKYIDEARPQLVAEPDDKIVFLSNAGDPFSLDYLTEMVRGYVKAADDRQAAGACHLFRHTMATLMLEGGADIRFIQAMLGHANLKTTQIYTHVAVKQLQAIHRATHPAKLEKAQRELDELLEADAGEDAEE